MANKKVPNDYDAGELLFVRFLVFRIDLLEAAFKDLLRIESNLRTILAILFDCIY